MASSVIFPLVCVAIVGVVNFVVNKLLFKDSIVLKVVLILTFPILAIAGLGFLLGVLGISHVVWIAFLALVSTTSGNYAVKIKIQNPLTKILDRINILSEGNVNVDFSEDEQKGKDEIAIMYRLMAKLSKSLKDLTKFADDIGKGNLDAEYQLSSENDELGKAMLSMRDSLIKAEKEKMARQQEDDKRNWVTTGVAKFAEILRSNHDDLAELSNNVISNLLKYIHAIQGGIFIVNDDDSDHTFLELQAFYAYERKKYLHKEIEIGEGLVGTCYLEKEPIYITQVPKDYMSVTSGLGDDAPRALFLVPLKVNNMIYGIMEIASFQVLEPYEREFVEKVSESIASTISSVKVNVRTQKLLETAKLQSEEMAYQEEELRQNLEELQATQEEMNRKQTAAETAERNLRSENDELRAKIAELETEIAKLTQ